MSNKITLQTDGLETVGENTNIKYAVVGSELILVIDMKQDLGLTDSGKSVVLATTKGYIGLGPNGNNIRVSLWAGRKMTKEEVIEITKGSE